MELILSNVFTTYFVNDPLNALRSLKTSDLFTSKNIIMKKSIFFPIVGVVLIFGVLASCSKDDQLIRRDETKSYIDPAANRPEVLYGSMKGIIDPVPSYASIMLKGDMGYAIEKVVSGDGSFWFDNLPAGNYYMKITYVVQRAGYSYIAYHEVEEVKIQQGSVSELGVVKLPWSY
jgi:hypothetical protein